MQLINKIHYDNNNKQITKKSLTCILCYATICCAMMCYTGQHS